MQFIIQCIAIPELIVLDYKIKKLYFDSAHNKTVQHKLQGAFYRISDCQKKLLIFKLYTSFLAVSKIYNHIVMFNESFFRYSSSDIIKTCHKY